jgi:uncharacterized FlaG/YvyC family protein
MQVNSVTPITASTSIAPTDHNAQRQGSFHAHSPENVQSAAESRFKPVTEDGKDIVYRTVDPETGAVLTQVPSEEVIRVAKKLEALRTEGKIR